MKPFDSTGAFHPIATGGDLRSLAVRGAGATLMSGGMSLAIQVVSTMVLARLLTPKDFGIVTMVTTFSLLFMNFGANGFTEAIIQRDEIDETLASNIFWIDVSVSFLLTLAFAAGGTLLARLYKDPRIVAVSHALALTIFITGLSVVHLALLKRAMRFSLASVIDIFGRASSVVVSIVLARQGWGYWALVAGTIATPATVTILVWFACRWMPRMPRNADGTRGIVKFAIHTYGRFTTGYFANNLDNFLVGWRLGATPLGFYKKAFDLFVLPSNQLSMNLTLVAVAGLSRFQKDLFQYRRYLLSALGVMAFVGMGIGADLTVVGKDMILVLLGPKWGESGRIFTMFGPGIGAMLLYCTHIWIHLSIGRADRWFRWGLIDLGVTALFLFAGLHWGTVGIALAWVGTYWVITLPAIWYACRPIDLGIGRVIGVLWKYVFASALAGGITYALLHTMPSLYSAAGASWAIVRIIVASLFFTTAYLVAVIGLHRSLAPIYQVLRLMREMISRRISPKASAPVEQEAVLL